MTYNQLRGTGVLVSRISLGTMNLSKLESKRDVLNLLKASLDNGINIIDCAEVYDGSEQFVGDLLSAFDRESLIIATKVFGRLDSHNVNSCGLNRKHINSAINNSLKKLRTDYIDIYFLHGMDSISPIEEALTTMDSLVRSGKILYYGLSNFTAWQTVEVLFVCERMNLIKPVVSQNIYNLLTRDLDIELIPCLKHFDIGLQVYNILAGGMLTGKYLNGIKSGSRFSYDSSYFERYWNECNINATNQLYSIANQYGITLTELAVRWCLTNSTINSLVVGFSSVSQMREVCAYVDNGALDSEIVDCCDRVWDSLFGRRQMYGRFFRRC